MINRAIGLCILGLMLLSMAGCAESASKHSREFLNCVYHQHYELGLSRATAEQRCVK